MSAIETRCPECGYTDVFEFSFRGLHPPLEEDACPRCLQALVAVAHLAPEEVGERGRPAASAGGALPVLEEAEAIQRVLLRATQRHLDPELAPAWDRRIGLRTGAGSWLLARAYVDLPAAARGVELFMPLAPPSSPSVALRAVCHALSGRLEGDVVLAGNDIDLARAAAAERLAIPFYRSLVALSAVEAGELPGRLAVALAEADAALAAVGATISGESPCHDATTGLIDESALVLPPICPQPLDDEETDAASAGQRVVRYLQRIGLLGEDEDASLPLAFRHGSSSVVVDLDVAGEAPRVRFSATIAVGVERRRLLPFLLDFNRAEEMGRFTLTPAGEVVFDHALLAEDLDAGELLRGLTLVAEIADDRDDVVAELGGGRVPERRDGERDLRPAFALLAEGGLMEDVAVSAAEAVARVDRYLHGLGIAPAIDAAGARWVHSGSTQVAIRAHDRSDGAVVVLQAPVLYEVCDSDDVPSVVNDLNLGQGCGAFIYDAGGRCVWYRDALFANDLDRSEFARALLEAAETADAHDEPLAERLGGRRTIDVVAEQAAAQAEAALELTLGALRSPDPMERLGAARSLARQEGVRVTDALTAALADPSEEVSAAALRSLLGSPAAASPDQVVSNLCGVAASEGYPPHARGHALWGLEVVGGESSLTAVRTALASEDAGLRARAARAAGRLARRGLGRASVAQAVLDLAWDVDPWVQREAVTAISAVAVQAGAEVDREAVVARLVPLLDGAPPEVHPSVFEALAQLGPVAAEAVAGLAGAPAASTRAGVARVLRSTAGPEQLDALRILASDSSGEVREDAVVGLARSGAPAAMETLLALFAADPDIDVRRMALEALVAAPGAAQDAALGEALAVAAESGDPTVREDAVWGIAALAGTAAALAGGERGRTLRRLFGDELPRLLDDLEERDRAGLADDEATAADVIARRLRAVGAGGARYPAYAFGLVRLLSQWGQGEAALAEVAAGSTALARAAAEALASGQR